MIDLIEVEIHNGCLKRIKAIIIPNQKIAYINDKKWEVSEEWLNSLINIITLWDREYGSSPIIDIEEFEVRVLSNQEETIFHGKGNYPTSYPSFLKLLEVPYDR